MKRWVPLVVLLVGSAAIALGAEIAQPGSRWVALAMIGGAIAVGELIELRPPLRAALPISFAYMVVLAGRASIGDAALVLVVALLATFLVRSHPASVEGRIALFVERLAEGMSAVLVYHCIAEVFGPQLGRGPLLLALGAAAIAPLAVGECARMVRARSVEFSLNGRMADVALVTSATLMGISDRGVAGHGGMGLWGPAIFTIPLLAAWYSYDHLEVIRRTYEQTIRALGAAPEMGGLVRDGHSERVAALAVAIGDELGLSRHDVEHLETAALLHHLGQVCLDEPEDGLPPDPVAVADAGATILRGTQLLAPAGDIIASEWIRTPEKDNPRPSALSGQILRVASAFDELSNGDPEQAAFAYETLCSAPIYLFDARVLAGLELVLDRRGLLGVTA